MRHDTNDAAATIYTMLVKLPAGLWVPPESSRDFDRLADAYDSISYASAQHYSDNEDGGGGNALAYWDAMPDEGELWRAVLASAGQVLTSARDVPFWQVPQSHKDRMSRAGGYLRLVSLARKGSMS